MESLTETSREVAEIDSPIRAADGLSPLCRIAKILPVTGQPEVSPDNLQPMIAVTGRIAEFILLLFLHERSWLPIIIIACSLLSTTADCWSCRS